MADLVGDRLRYLIGSGLHQLQLSSSTTTTTTTKATPTDILLQPFRADVWNPQLSLNPTCLTRQQLKQCLTESQVCQRCGRGGIALGNLIYAMGCGKNGDSMHHIHYEAQPRYYEDGVLLLPRVATQWFETSGVLDVARPIPRHLLLHMYDTLDDLLATPVLANGIRVLELYATHFAPNLDLRELGTLFPGEEEEDVALDDGDNDPAENPKLHATIKIQQQILAHYGSIYHGAASSILPYLSRDSARARRVYFAPFAVFATVDVRRSSTR